MATIGIGGIFIGFCIFLFTFIASKKTGKFYLAPIVTFLIGLLIILYGFFKVGGFEGMGYGILGIGIWVISICGIMVLPFIKAGKSPRFSPWDKTVLFSIPVLLFGFIGWVFISFPGYWVNEQGGKIAGYDTTTYYRTSTISEGAKQIYIQLGEKYKGKQLEIKNIKTIGNTEVTVKITNKGKPNELPFITIGLDKIVEPLVVQTTDGEIIHSEMDNSSP